jgi:hypothetical protein
MRVSRRGFAVRFVTYGHPRGKKTALPHATKTSGEWEIQRRRMAVASHKGYLTREPNGITPPTMMGSSAW